MKKFTPIFYANQSQEDMRLKAFSEHSSIPGRYRTTTRIVVLSSVIFTAMLLMNFPATAQHYFGGSGTTTTLSAGHAFGGDGNNLNVFGLTVSALERLDLGFGYGYGTFSIPPGNGYSETRRYDTKTQALILSYAAVSQPSGEPFTAMVSIGGTWAQNRELYSDNPAGKGFVVPIQVIFTREAATQYAPDREGGFFVYPGVSYTYFTVSSTGSPAAAVIGLDLSFAFPLRNQSRLLAGINYSIATNDSAPNNTSLSFGFHF